MVVNVPIKTMYAQHADLNYDRVGSPGVPGHIVELEAPEYAP